MLFRTVLACLLIVPGMSFSQSHLVETMRLERSDHITLSTLTDNVYQRHPAHHNHLASQQQVNANTDLASARFANAGEMSIRHQNDIVGSSDGLQEWEAMAEMSLWLPGQKQQQLMLSDKMVAEVPAYKQQIRLKASAMVRKMIWNIALAETAIKQAYQAEQTAQKLEQDVKARVKAGELADVERLLASTNALEKRSHYLSAQADLKLALSHYQYMTGETALPNSYEESLFERAEQHPASIVVNQQHPELMILDRQISTLRTRQEIAQFDSAVNPSVSIGIRGEKGAYGESFNNSIGIGINIALDDKVYRQPAIADAAKALADLEIRRQKLERELNITLLTVLHELESRKQQLILIDEQESTNRQYLARQQRAFDLGEIDLISLLRSQELYQETHNRKQRLEVDIKQMIAKVNQALGIVL